MCTTTLSSTRNHSFQGRSLLVSIFNPKHRYTQNYFLKVLEAVKDACSMRFLIIASGTCIKKNNFSFNFFYMITKTVVLLFGYMKQFKVMGVKTALYFFEDFFMYVSLMLEFNAIFFLQKNKICYATLIESILVQKN